MMKHSGKFLLLVVYQISDLLNCVFVPYLYSYILNNVNIESANTIFIKARSTEMLKTYVTKINSTLHYYITLW